METTHKYVQSLVAASEKIDQIEKDINDLVGGRYRYKLEFILKTYTSLFDRFCPFKVGDRVQLKTTPEISKDVAWGWLGAKHFLVEGAIATVVTADYRDDSFEFGLQFDDDSWVDRSGNLRLVEIERRGIFWFGETYLTPLTID